MHAALPKLVPEPKKTKHNLREIPDDWLQSTPYFEEAMELLFGKMKNLPELAKIAAFLSDTRCCVRCLEAVDEKLSKLYVSKAVAADAGSPRKKLSQCILQLAQAGGFNQMEAVVLTGDAGTAFGMVTGNKILFKDGISKIHGEFTHSLQWLAVIEASEMLKIPKQQIADLYAQAGTTSTQKGYELTGEKPGGKGERQKKSGLFDFVCDAFLFREGDQDQRFILHALFSKSARSPAFVSTLIEHGVLRFLQSYYYGPIGKYNNDHDKKRNNLQKYRRDTASQGVSRGTLQRIGRDEAFAPPNFYDLPDPLHPEKLIGEHFDPNYKRKQPKK